MVIMGYRFLEKPFILYETVEMIHRYINRIPLSSLAQRSPVIYSNIADTKMAGRMSALTEIMNRICENLDTKSEEFAFFFSPYPTEHAYVHLCLARQLTHLVVPPTAPGLEESAAAICQTWRTIQSGRYCLISSDVGSIYVDRLPPDERQVSMVEQVCALNIATEYKLQLIRVLSDFDTYMDRLVNFIRPYAQQLEAELENNSWIMAELIQQWQEHFLREPPEDFAKRAMGFDTTCQETVIGIFLMNCNEFMLSTREDASSGTEQNYFILGSGVRAESSMEGTLQSAPYYSEVLAKAMHMMGDKCRLEILHRLTEGPHYCQELAEDFGINPGTISRYLTALLDCGLINCRREGGRTYYYLEPNTIRYFLHQVEQYLLPENADTPDTPKQENATTKESR